MIKKLIVGILLSLIAPAIFAVEITSQPGAMESLMKDNLDETSLVVKGEMDARDFKFIYDNLSKLSTLDISGVNIAEFNGNTVYFGSQNNYQANQLPPYCFFGKEYTSVILPTSITSIAEGAFSGCKNLANIVFPSSLQRIGDFSFYDCDALVSVTIPSTVNQIGEYAFAESGALKSININSTASNFAIPRYCFRNCTMLETVKLPDNTAIIGENSFVGCRSLKNIDFPSNLSVISASAFQGVPLSSIDLSDCNKLTSIGDWAFAENQELTTMKFNAELKNIGIGAFFYNDKMDIDMIPNELSGISDYLFAGCGSITANEVPINVVSIGKYAFADWTQMIKFTLQEGVNEIGDNAFENCSNLSDFYVKSTEVPALGENVFAGIDQKGRKLYVRDYLLEAYKSAPQWKEFDIQIETSVVKTEKNETVKAYFAGTILIVDASQAIEEALIYDVKGLELTHINSAAQHLEIETVNFSSRFYIVALKMANGEMHRIKLIRK